ncbi:hypothetical protein Sviol_45290 [Streptomyces violascens]|uniref:Uncharacterized protein n=1 Tax=Streptomyces violascens TaxID=67381 RepID=A0ABQ3QS74_9ACTN|nr:hypothetical protein Sviol_45290 [Streptomyces violascens]
MISVEDRAGARGSALVCGGLVLQSFEPAQQRLLVGFESTDPISEIHFLHLRNVLI